MDNVASFKKPVAFPTLWPTKNWFKASTAVMHNIPPVRGTQKYFFHIKLDVPSKQKPVMMSLVLQPSGVVMFNPCDTQANTDRVAAYVDRHRAKLRDIGNAQEAGTSFVLVGKLANHENRETFCVYYILDGNYVYVDEVTMRVKLKLDINNYQLDDYLLPMPGHLSEAEITNEPPKIECDYISRMDRTQSAIGIPVVSVESRGYNETPVLMSTPRQLAFMGFTVKGDEKWPENHQ